MSSLIFHSKSDCKHPQSTFTSSSSSTTSSSESASNPISALVQLPSSEEGSLIRNHTFRELNSLSALMGEFVTRILIERNFFQNTHIPQELFLYLANDLIKALNPAQKEHLNLATEATIVWDEITTVCKLLRNRWKRFRNQPLTKQEQEVAFPKNSLKEIDVFSEVLNGLKYATYFTLGEKFCHSVTNALTEGLWKHTPAIVGYYATLLLGSKSVGYIVKEYLQNSNLSEETQRNLEPWLNAIGRLALGFIPKVHASAEGVHYHYPSLQGYTQTVTNQQTVTMAGDTLRIEREGQLNTPEGTFPGVGSVEFKLNRIEEISEERVCIEVINQTGKTVPVEFTVKQGDYGPEISVKSPDSQLEQHWAAYFKPQPKPEQPRSLLTSSKQVIIDPHHSSSLACPMGLTLGALGSAATLNPLPMALGALSCLTPATAVSVFFNDFMEKLLANHDYLSMIKECEAIPESERTGEFYFYLGLAHRKLGSWTKANECFDKLDEERFLENEVVKKVKNNVLWFNTPLTIDKIRPPFFEEIGMNAPSHYEYIAMSVLAYKDRAEILKDSQYEKLNEVYTKFTKDGWLLGSSSADLGITENGYYGIAFVHKAYKRVIIAHRGVHLTNTSDLGAELARIFKKERPARYAQAIAYAEKIAKEYEGYTLSHTGHGIGATVADLVAFDRSEWSITLDGVGTKELLYNQHRNVDSIHKVTYLSSPNFFNTFRGHYGELRILSPKEKTTPQLLISAMEKIVKDWLPSNQFISVDSVVQGFDIAKIAADEVASHDAGNLLANFDSQKAYSNSYRIASKWPHTTTNLFEYKGLCASHQLNYDNPISSDPDTQFELGKLYSTTSAEETTDRTRMKLAHLPNSIQNVVKSFYENGTYYEDLNPRILMLYKIQGDTLVIRSDDKIFNCEDLKNALEHDLIRASRKLAPKPHPAYQCCIEPQAAPATLEENPGYSIFFNLPCIKTLPSEAHHTLKEYIKEGKSQEFKQYLELVGSRQIFDKINSELVERKIMVGRYKKESMNHVTLINKLFQDKFIVNYKFSAIKNEAPEFFQGKSFSLSDKYRVNKIQGIIDSIEQSCDRFNVKLADGSSISIPMRADCQSEVALVESKWTQSLYSFIEFDYDASSKEQIHFELIPDRDKLTALYEISAEGEYVISKVKRPAKMKCVHIAKKGTSQTSFQIVTHYNDQHEIESIDFKDLNRKAQQNLTIEEFKHAFNIRYLEKKSVPLDPEAIDKLVLIREVEKNQKPEILSRIEALEKKLIYNLTQESDLDQYLKELAKNNFKEFTSETLSKKYQEPLNKIHALYASLEEHFTAMQILIKAALEANYRKIVDREDSLAVSETLALITQANQFINELKGKNLVLFLGPSGSGKSTSIFFLLGYKLFEDTQSFPPIWKEEPNQEGVFPKISHQLGTSETSYLQGYSLQLDDAGTVMLCDSAGLGDTRGKHYELVTNLSIERVLKLADSVKVVVTIPLSTFLEGKGQSVYELLSRVNKWVPNAFTAKTEEGLFLLITKHADNSEKNFNKILEDLAATNNGDNNERNLMWQRLKAMNLAGKVNFVRLNDFENREKLYTNYIEGPGLDLNLIGSSVPPKLDSKLTSILAQATSIWSDLIQDRFVAIPNRIQELNQSIDGYTSRITQMKASIQQYIEDIEELQKPSTAAIIKTDSLPNYSKCLDTLEYYQRELEDAKNNRAELSEEINTLNSNIVSMSVEILDLSSSSELKEFVDYHPKVTKTTKICHLKPGALEKMFEEFRGRQESDCSSFSTVENKNYLGTLTHIYHIEQEYWLMPKDEKQKADFLAQGLVMDGNRRFQLKFSGSDSTLKTIKPHDDGKRMIYEIETKWRDTRFFLDYSTFERKSDKELPSHTIVHDLPGDVIHATVIGILRNQIKRLEEELKQKTSDLEEACAVVRHFESRVYEQTSRCEKGRCIDVAEAIQEKQNRIAQLTDDIKAHNSAKQIKIEEREAEKTKQEMVEIIFQTRSGALEALLNLCKEALPIDQSASESSILALSCKSFIERHQLHFSK